MAIELSAQQVCMISDQNYTTRSSVATLLQLLQNCNILLMGLYDLDLSYYLVSTDSSTCKYNLRHTIYQFKIRYARTNVLKLSYFFRIVKSWNSLPLHLRKTESLDDFKDCLRSFLHMKDISTFS